MLLALVACSTPAADPKPDPTPTPTPERKEIPAPPPSSTPPPRAPALELENQKLTDAALETMIRDGKVTADIVEVRLHSNQLTSHALELLAASPLVTLQALDLHDNPIDDAGAAVLAREPLFRGLNSLDIGRTHITRAGVEALFAPDSKLVGPTHLGLDGLPIGDAGLDALLASRFAASLRSLSIVGTGVTDAGARRLAESKAIPNLMFLQISKDAFEPETVAALARLRMDFRLAQI